MKSSPRCFLGIDPGLHGAVAMITESQSVVSLQDTPVLMVKKGKGNRTVYVETAMAAILENMRDSGNVVCVGIENVHSMPGQGVTSMFSMGTGFGIWLGILAALRLPYQRIEPQAWKRAMAMQAKSDKNASIVRALQVFPRADIRLKKHDGRAEALLLAAYTARLASPAHQTPSKPL